MTVEVTDSDDPGTSIVRRNIYYLIDAELYAVQFHSERRGRAGRLPNNRTYRHARYLIVGLCRSRDNHTDR